MRKYNLIFQQALKNIILAVIVIAIFTPVAYAVKPNTLQPVSNLIVVDANGKKVGDVISIASDENTRFTTAIIAFTVNKTLLTLNVSPDVILGTGSNSLIFYQSTDCSGATFMELFGVTILPSTTISAPGTTVYLATPNNTPQCITTMSKWNGGCIAGQEQHCVVPATPLVDLDSLFTPPFSVQGK